jgi:acyl transferase domain-containing protein
MHACDAVTPVPLERWETEHHSVVLLSTDAGGAGAPPRFGSFLPDAALFDVAVFGVSAAEAALMDPQQRLLMESLHDALAGLSSRGAASSAGGVATSVLGTPAAAGAGGDVAARFGVYVGVSSPDHMKIAAASKQGVTAFSATGGLSVLETAMCAMRCVRLRRVHALTAWLPAHLACSL